MQDHIDIFARAKAENEAHKKALTELLKADQPNDVLACQSVYAHHRTVEDAIAALSSSEEIVVALAFGRIDLLDGECQNFRYAWQRLDMRQRRVVDVFARAHWEP